MPDPVPPTAPFDLWPFEETMRMALATARSKDNRELLVVPADGAVASLRGPFLRWLLVEAIPALSLPLIHFELSDAVITHELDLSGTKLTVLPRFANCRFNGPINLEDAEIIGFEMIAGSALKISADRLTTTGSLLVRAANPDDEYPPVGQQPEIEKQIRLCGANIHGNLDLSGCRLRGRNPPGKKRVPLFADGLTVEGNLILGYGFEADGEIRLNGCEIHRNLDCSGAHLRNLPDDAAHDPAPYTLSAAGAHIAGSVYMCRTPAWVHEPVDFVSEGTLRLDGAKIDGDLDCTGGQFTAIAFARENWRRETGTDSDLYAIRADSMEVGGDIKLVGAFHVQGTVDLTGAKIGDDFICVDGFFDFPGEDALCADGITVSGTTSLCRSSADNDRTTTNGILRFPLATFKQGFFVERAAFDVNGTYCNWLRGPTTAGELNCPGRGICGIFAPLAEVNGEFRWREIKKPPPRDRHNPLWLHLAGSKADRVTDDEPSWRNLDRFNVIECDYSSLSHLSGDVAWRVRELDGEYAILNPRADAGRLTWSVGYMVLAWCAFARACCRRCLSAQATDRFEKAVEHFYPQPYIQLAKTFRDAGYEDAADEVLVRLERNRTRYANFGAAHQFWRWILGLGLQYGYAPFRALRILLIWTAVSAVSFQMAFHDKLIVAAKDNSCPTAKAGSSGEETKSNDAKSDAAAGDTSCIAFSALVFAADTLVPIVDLNQKKNWLPKSPSMLPEENSGAAMAHWWQAIVPALEDFPSSGPTLLLIFNTFFGWLMTTLFAAGVSGLVRGSKDSG